MFKIYFHTIDCSRRYEVYELRFLQVCGTVVILFVLSPELAPVMSVLMISIAGIVGKDTLSIPSVKIRILST